MIGRRFVDRMAAGKQAAMDKRNRGFASGQHTSWERIAKARAEAERNDPDAEADYHRRSHLAQLAAVKRFHNQDWKQAIVEHFTVARKADDNIPF